MNHNRVFNDRQAKTCSANLFAAALIHTIKTLKNTFLIRFRNAYSCIFYRQYGAMLFLRNRNNYIASGMVILDRIITKVIHNAVQQLWDCFYGRTFSTNINRNIHLRSSSLQRIDSIFCNTIQIAVLPLHINIATVQLCQINNIFDQSRHPQ